MTDDYTERARIVAWRLLSGILVTVGITFLAYSVFFAGEGGLQKPERYPVLGWTIATVVLVGARLFEINKELPLFRCRASTR